MQRSQPSGGDAGEDGLPDELVPEGVGRCVVAEHPGRDALVDGVRGDVGHLVQKGGLGARPDHGRDSRASRACGDRRWTRARTASWTVAGSVLTTGRDHLGDEEGVAAGLPEQGLGIDAGAGRQLSHRVRGQQRHLQPPYDRLRGDVAEHHPQRVGRTQVLVPIRRDDEDLGAVEPPGEEAREVERGHVGPVQVLHDQDRGSGLAEGSQRGLEEAIPPPRAEESVTSEPRSGATSTNGPRGRGEDRGSQAPHSTRASEPAVSLQARTSADFPTPASPCTRARRPDPCSASSCRPLKVRQKLVPLDESHVLRVGTPSAARGKKARLPESSSEGSWARISRSAPAAVARGRRPARRRGWRGPVGRTRARRPDGRRGTARP